VSRSTLRDRFVTVDETVDVGDWTVTITKPRSSEDLISGADFDVDERLPYWAELWPSAAVLATHTLAHARPARRALELGCGLGLASLAARRAGLSVLATDYYDVALEFVALNAAANGVGTIETRMVDWRHWPTDLGQFDLVLGADILYERPMGPLVAHAIAQALSPDGRAWITDPGRVGAEPFLAAAAEHNLSVTTFSHVHPGDPARKITRYELRHASPSRSAP
jgi:predicted nicotinamide N-methyase